MKTQHTPGPWRILPHPRNSDHLMGGDHARIALLDDCHLEPVASANARLIAAAPEMLEALKVAIEYLDRLPAAPQGSIAEVAQCGVRHQVRHAIYNAEGRA